MNNIYQKGNVFWNMLLSFTLTFGSLLSGPLTVKAGVGSTTTSFQGTLETGSTFVRPEMPGDVYYDNNDNAFPIMLEKIWYFQEGVNAASCGNGNYNDCGTWFDNPDFTGTPQPFTTTLRTDPPDPSGESYVRNYFYRTISPSADGEYTILVTPQTNLEDAVFPNDTVLYLYKNNFDPAHPLHNLIAGNDDISESSDNYLSQIKDTQLEANVTYYVVMTGFAKGSTGPVYFDIAGPGSVDVSDPDAPGVTSVTVTPSTADVVQGGSKQLTATVAVTGGADQAVNWTSSDTTGQVTVDETGKVTVAPDATLGDYMITATSTADSSKSDTSTITVTAAPAVTSVTVTPSTADVVQGGSKQLTATVTVTGGADQAVTWKSSDATGLVTVDETGKVTVAPDAALGDYTITATSTVDSSKSDTSAITVTAAPAVTSVTVTPSTADVVQGGSKQLTATVAVVGGAAQTVNWTSSDTTGQVSVDGAGNVTVAPDAALGDYIITATSTVDSSKSDTSTITVTAAPAVTSVTVTPSTADVVQGGSKQLTATVAVVGGAAQTVNWTSGDTTGQVSVDETGKVTVAPDAALGDYTITATSTVDSSKSNTATITVTQAPVNPSVTSVTVTPSTADVVQGGSKQLTATVTVTGGADQAVTWKSSDTTGQVSVDETGKVTVAPYATLGDYTITATSTVDSSKSNTATITVTQAPVNPSVTSVTVTPSTADVVQGGSKQLTATVAVVGGADQAVNWTSSDTTGQVTVDETGKVTVAPDATLGDYTITATSTEDNSKFSSAVITVKLAPAEPTYTVEEISDQTARSLTEGYGSGTQETKSITVLNTGTGTLTNLKVELSAGDIQAFEWTPVDAVLNSGEEGSFTVKAKDGLAAGTYKAAVTLTADQLPAVTFQVTQVVKPQTVPTNPNPPVTTTPVVTAPSTPAPSQPENQAVEVLVNGKVEKAGTLVNSTVDNHTVSTVVVDPEKLNDKLAAEGDHTIVTIPITTGSDILIGELNGQMVKNLEQKQAVLKIQTDKAAYSLPAQQINIDAISNQIGQAVTLSDIKIQIQISVPTAEMEQVVQRSSADGGFSITVPPMDFSIQGSYGDTKVDISRFNTYVERSVILPEGVDPDKITTGVVIDPDGSIRHVPTKVVETNGTYSAVINSLTNSTYTVVWHPVEFSDVAEHWSKAAVNDMGSRMIVDGTGNGLYSPNQDITRAEFAAIIVRALGLKVESKPASFADVQTSAWYADAVETAYDYKLISGFDDGLFHPMDKITREQAMMILSRAMALTGLNENLAKQNINGTLAPFSDGSDVSSWAKEQTADTLQAGIINGKSGQMLAPKDYVTRAEVAAIMQRLLQKSGLI